MNEKVELINECIELAYKKIKEIANRYSLALKQDLSQSNKKNLRTDRDKKILEIKTFIRDFQDMRSDELRKNE
jgi:hypothetical protein